MALMYHPDKLGESITEADKEIWLKIQSSYETLLDPKKRVKYDSSLPFDDTIPVESELTDENFYETLSAIFNRNSRFSKKKPVPTIGDKETPMDQVYKFYKFWDNFDSWREFSQFAEYDVTEAQDRYERRYMEKENRKVTDKYMKKERARLIKLAEMAYNNDPRIKAIKIAAELEKQKKKEEVKQRKD